MKSNWKNLVTAVAIGTLSAVLVGCGTDKTPVFTDEATIPRLPSNTMALPDSTLPGLSKEDETKLELTVFRTMLTQHQWNPTGPTAIFLDADDSEVKKLRGEFPGLIPPIKPTKRIDLSMRNMPMDKDTGKPAIILSMELMGTTADGAMEVTGKWFSSTSSMGIYSFLLTRNGDGWNIQNA